MSSTPATIYQFKITLEDIKPPIWRRIQVPDSYTFWDLHIAIQDAMGWQNCHMHDFNLLNPQTKQHEMIGIPDDEGVTIPGWRRFIADYFLNSGNKAIYGYDFGDQWFHDIVLEKIVEPDLQLTYPVCLEGQRACPPEDCGGVIGYQEILQILQDPEHEDYQDQCDWLESQGFDAEVFDATSVTFSDPQQSLKRLIV